MLGLSGKSTDKMIKIGSSFNDDRPIEIITEPDGIHCAPVRVNFTRNVEITDKINLMEKYLNARIYILI